ncbi:dehydrogenase [Lithospermum erythrorhizon]|uniref:Short-chain dehydrogenase/reductase n=1 Tax=Lithospermum erythrorhizon TaxID=34254 RepID=A0AAV3QBP3_LITER
MEGYRAGRIAIVTGANKGIGYEICKQLVEKGIIVVLTSRDEKRGQEALERLKKDIDASDCVLFHQLDVADPASIATLVDFITNKFGRLDILVNNAGVPGVQLEDPILYQELVEADIRRVSFDELVPEELQQKALANLDETHELAEQCFQINYYGAKRMVESFIPLLQLSDAPRIVNATSNFGKLTLQNSESVKNILNDTESLTEDKLDEVINEFLEHLKEGPIQRKVWPFPFSAYKVSKASLNAYTRIISKKYPEMLINAVCPGYVHTDITAGTGPLTAKEGAESVVKLAILPNEGPSGLFFSRQEVTSF